MTPPKISDAEWGIMNVLWQNAPLTVADLMDRIGHSQGWKDKTVHTFLSRLVKKGALRVEKEGRRHLYFPTVSQEACVREASKNLAERLFHGASSSLLVRLVEETPLSAEELADLQEILDAKKGDTAK